MSDALDLFMYSFLFKRNSRVLCLTVCDDIPMIFQSEWSVWSFEYPPPARTHGAHGKIYKSNVTAENKVLRGLILSPFLVTLANLI